MKELGYPWTWPTSCFIGPDGVGCGAATFAHTNGDGDFVLFDSLGPPWPIHACYQRRDQYSDRHWSKAVDVEAPRPKKVWKSASDIQRADAASYRLRSEFHLVGYLQEHHPAKRNQWLKKAGGLGASIIWKILAEHPDQFTIVVGDPDAGLKSYTAFGNISQHRPRAKDMVAVTLRAVPILLGAGEKEFIFIAENISVLKW